MTSKINGFLQLVYIIQYHQKRIFLSWWKMLVMSKKHCIYILTLYFGPSKRAHTSLVLTGFVTFKNHLLPVHGNCNFGLLPMRCGIVGLLAISKFESESSCSISNFCKIESVNHELELFHEIFLLKIVWPQKIINVILTYDDYLASSFRCCCIPIGPMTPMMGE
jgi:hypothetical protein